MRQKSSETREGRDSILLASLGMAAGAAAARGQKRERPAPGPGRVRETTYPKIPAKEEAVKGTGKDEPVTTLAVIESTAALCVMRGTACLNVHGGRKTRSEPASSRPTGSQGTRLAGRKGEGQERCQSQIGNLRCFAKPRRPADASRRE